MQTFFLTERRPSECRLSGEDVAFLIERHRSHLQLLPTREAGVFLLRPTRLVGILAAPNCRLVIRPKLPLQSFAFLLDPAALPEPQASAQECLRDESGLLDFLALRLARLVSERVSAGLQRGYAEVSSEGPYLQGRLDMPAQLRDLARRDVLHSVRDELTVDILCNRLPRSTLELLLRSPLLGEPVVPALRQALTSLPPATPVPLSPENFTCALAERNTLAYRPLLELCRLVAQSLQPPAGAGGPDVSFLLDLERLFERQVTRGLSEEFAGDQRFHLAVQPLFELSGVRLRPDTAVSEQAQVCLIVDAKWKRLRRGGVNQADFYQALAYAAALGSPRVVLVYPGRHDDSWTVPVPHAQLEVEVRTLRVTAGRSGCLRSLRKLARNLRRQCRL